jgi:NAD(P)-dependent dehydrogenase (short-subunit alcohol dehydrogenase family)
MRVRKQTMNKSLLLLVSSGAAVWLARSALRPRPERSLESKTVLITGGSRGLGLVLAREFAARGAQVAISARDADELRRAKEDLIQRGAPSVLVLPCDLSDKRQIDGMVRNALEHFGHIDILVNNAGIIQVGPAEEMTLEDFEEAIKIHFWAPLYAIWALLPDMRRRGAGRIINIASIGGKLSVPHLLPYNASKFALVGFSEGLRAELLKNGIVVTTACPGPMRTGSPVNAHFKGKHREEHAWFSISSALPILSIQAERAARAIISASMRGDAEVVVTLPARIAAKLHGLFPELTQDLLGLVNRFLPEPGGIGTRKAKGEESKSALSPSWLTSLSDRAAQNNNQLG